MEGTTVCYVHGGPAALANRGTGNGNFKHGRYATMPERMIESFHAAMQDPALLSLRADIAAIDARIGDLLRRVDSGESGAFWAELKEARKELRRARVTKSDEQIEAAIAAIEELIDAGSTDYAAWGEIRQLQEQRRKHTDSERKALVELQQNIPAERALAMAYALRNAIEQEVTDRETLDRIRRAFEQILNARSAT